MSDPNACYCSEYASGGVPCPPGTCPNVPEADSCPVIDQMTGWRCCLTGTHGRHLFSAPKRPASATDAPTKLEALANSWWDESIKNNTIIEHAGIWQKCAWQLREVVALGGTELRRVAELEKQLATERAGRERLAEKWLKDATGIRDGDGVTAAAEAIECCVAELWEEFDAPAPPSEGPASPVAEGAVAPVPSHVTLRLPYMKGPHGSSADLVLEDVSVLALADNGFVSQVALTTALNRRDYLYSETIRLSKELIAVNAQLASERAGRMHLEQAAEILRLEPGMDAVDRHHAWLDRDDDSRSVTPAPPSEGQKRCPMSSCDCSGCVFCRVNHSCEARADCHCRCERQDPSEGTASPVAEGFESCDFCVRDVVARYCRRCNNRILAGDADAIGKGKRIAALRFQPTPTGEAKDSTPRTAEAEGACVSSSESAATGSASDVAPVVENTGHLPTHTPEMLTKLAAQSQPSPIAPAAEVERPDRCDRCNHMRGAHSDTPPHVCNTLSCMCSYYLAQKTEPPPTSPPAKIRLREPTQSKTPPGGILSLTDTPPASPPAGDSGREKPALVQLAEYFEATADCMTAHEPAVRKAYLDAAEVTRSYLPDPPQPPSLGTVEDLRAELIAALRNLAGERKKNWVVDADDIRKLADELAKGAK